MKFGYEQLHQKRFTPGKQRAVAEQPDGSGLDQVGRADKISAFMVHLHQSLLNKKSQCVRLRFSPNYYDFATSCSLQDWLGWVRRQHRR